MHPRGVNIPVFPGDVPIGPASRSSMRPCVCTSVYVYVLVLVSLITDICSVCSFSFGGSSPRCDGPALQYIVHCDSPKPETPLEEEGEQKKENPEDPSPNRASPRSPAVRKNASIHRT
ncbi:hypothetical protein BDW22DRAFT_1213991 [Trametopsis cervina]|nr:hypothetical protein BDW22DRAFT_1213991 [Trametopsis cervina]